VAKSKIIVGFAVLFTLSLLSFAEEIHNAAWKGDLNKLKLLLDKNALLVNLEDNRGWTPLHWAVVGQQKEVVIFLVSKGAVVKVSDNNDRTPLHYAAYYGFRYIAEFLIEQGAIADAKAIGGASPLHWAATGDQTTMGEFLISKGADIHAKCNAEITPLYWTVFRGNIDFTKLLISHGAKVNFADYTGRTPLQVAVMKGFSEICEILINAGADTSIKDNYAGRTLLHLASIHGHKPVIDLLLEQSFNPNLEDSKKITPLYYAIKYGHKSAIDVLTINGAKTINTEKIHNSSIFLNKKLQENEAIFWRLRGRSWGIKTKKSFLIFNYSQDQIIPADASLDSGFLISSEMKGQNIFYFDARHPQNAHGLKVLQIAKNTAQNTYVLNKDFQKRYEELGIQEAIYLNPGDTKKINGLEIITTPSKGQDRGYYVKSDGIAIVWSPNKVNHYSPIDTFSEDIKYLIDKGSKIDVLILGTPLGLGPENDLALEGILEELDKLNVKIVIPRGDDHLCRKLIQQAKTKHIRAKVYYAENPGDCLIYNKGKIQ
jgi:ankyrin repeat protein